MTIKSHDMRHMSQAIRYNYKRTCNLQRACVNSFSEFISSLTHVCSRIFCVRIQDVHGDISKVVNSPVPVPGPDLLAVEEPFNGQIWVVDGFNSALEVGSVTFLQVLETCECS